MDLATVAILAACTITAIKIRHPFVAMAYVLTGVKSS